MNLPVHRTIRFSIGWLLVSSLLGLGGLDAVVCLGNDGHFGIETRVSSCCPIVLPAPISEGADALDRGQRDTSCDESCQEAADLGCDHAPLTHWTGPTRHLSPVPAGAGEPIGPSLSCACGSERDAKSRTRRVDPALLRLRTTTLLI